MAYAENQSFTTVANLQARLQKTFSGSTTPSDSQVITFLCQRAAEVQAVLIEVGLAYTAPAGASPIPVPPTAAATDVLYALCQMANDLAAAGDAVAAHDTAEPDGFPAEAVAFWNEAKQARARLRSYCESAFDAGVTKSHTDTGGITSTDWGAVGHNEEKTQDALFGLDTKW